MVHRTQIINFIGTQESVYCDSPLENLDRNIRIGDIKVIEVKNLSKKFDISHHKATSLKESFVWFLKRNKYEKKTLWALRDVDLEVKRGECIGIVGENGSGKTTLLKIIGKILEPTEGKVVVRGKIAPLLTLGVGFEQELTARENVYLYGSIMGLSKMQIDDKYEKIVEFSELRNFMDTKLKNFSSGMQIRLGFATAINVDADVLLVDEVLSVGDGAFQKKCLEKFNEFKRENKTILYVSHSLDSIRDYCDKAIFLHHGMVRASGETEKVLELYETYLTNKHLRGHNRGIIGALSTMNRGKQTIKDLKIFGHEKKESYVLESGKPFYLLFIPENVPHDVFIATIKGKGNQITLLSKNFEKNIVKFKVGSLPLKKGSYEISIGCPGTENIIEPHKFRIFIKEKEEPTCTKRVFIEDLRKLDERILVFGEEYDNILENFERGETLVSFDNIEDARKGFGRGAVFLGEKIVFQGDSQKVVEYYNDLVYESIVKDRIVS